MQVSRKFYRDVIGLVETGEDAQGRVYFKAWDERDHNSIVLRQADMGILLAFMFVWNMLGALILLPALAHFLFKPASVLATAQGGVQGAALGGPDGLWDKAVP